MNDDHSLRELTFNHYLLLRTPYLTDHKALTLGYLYGSQNHGNAQVLYPTSHNLCSVRFWSQGLSKPTKRMHQAYFKYLSLSLPLPSMSVPYAAV
jgi:hypothetical protein